MTDEEFIDLCSYQYVKASEVEEAIKNGANVNARRKDSGDTALMLADRAEIVEVLLRHGANVHAKNKEGNTALIERINSNRDSEAPAMLLMYGADVNTRDSTGDTALMCSIHHGYIMTTELLLKHGANVNAKNNLGYTALDCSYSKEAAEILRRYITE